MTNTKLASLTLLSNQIESLDTNLVLEILKAAVNSDGL